MLRIIVEMQLKNNVVKDSVLAEDLADKIGSNLESALMSDALPVSLAQVLAAFVQLGGR